MTFHDSRHAGQTGAACLPDRDDAALERGHDEVLALVMSAPPHPPVHVVSLLVLERRREEGRPREEHALTPQTNHTDDRGQAAAQLTGSEWVHDTVCGQSSKTK